MEPKLSCFTLVPTIFLFFSFVEGADTLFVHWQCTQHRPSQWYDPYLWRLHLYAGTTKYPSTPFSIGWFQQSICWAISTLTLSNQLVLTHVYLHFSFLVQLDLQWLFHRSSRVCCGAMWSGYCADDVVQPQLLTFPPICSPLSTSCAGWSPGNNRQMPVIGTLWEESILVVTCWMSSVQQLILKVSLYLARR